MLLTGLGWGLGLGPEVPTGALVLTGLRLLCAVGPVELRVLLGLGLGLGLGEAPVGLGLTVLPP